MNQNEKLLRIEELDLHFNTLQGPVQAVDDVNCTVDSPTARVVVL